MRIAPRKTTLEALRRWRAVDAWPWCREICDDLHSGLCREFQDRAEEIERRLRDGDAPNPHDGDLDAYKASRDFAEMG